MTAGTAGERKRTFKQERKEDPVLGVVRHLVVCTQYLPTYLPNKGDWHARMLDGLIKREPSRVGTYRNPGLARFGNATELRSSRATANSLGAVCPIGCAARFSLAEGCESLSRTETARVKQVGVQSIAEQCWPSS